MTNKKEAIIAIIDAFDEITRLEADNRALQVRLDATSMGNQADGDETPRWFGAIYEYGRREIFKKYTPYWKTVSVDEDQDGNRKAESITSWFKRVFDSVPDFMSREDFKREFEPELRSLYADELEKAMKGE